MSLKSLDEYNKERQAAFQAACDEANNGKRSGIACPKCGNELRIRTGMLLTSSPPQRHTFCQDDACGYRGYCIA